MFLLQFNVEALWQKIYPLIMIFNRVMGVILLIGGDLFAFLLLSIIHGSKSSKDVLLKIEVD